MSWSTDFSKMPPEGAHIFVAFIGSEEIPTHVKVGNFRQQFAVAWHPATTPEPYAPPKPEQIKPGDLCTVVGLDEKACVIEAIEKRTREIVAWESKYE